MIGTKMLVRNLWWENASKRMLVGLWGESARLASRRVLFVMDLGAEPLVSGLGTRYEASELVSYLLFEPPFIERLLDLGYQDTLAQSEEIRIFMCQD